MKKTNPYGLGLGAAVLLCFVFVAHAAVPMVINYQSRLRNANGDAITTATKVSFSLYMASSGGSAVWTESYSQSNSACKKITPDHNGYFSVQMGSCAAFPTSLSFTEPLFLGVTVESDAEAAPRVIFAPAPYAINAVRVGNFVSDTAAGTLSAESTGTATVSTPGFDSSALVFQGSGWNGSDAQNREFKIQTSVTNALNYRLGIFNNSPVSEFVSILNSGNVGIGMTTPAIKLDVAGDIQASGFLSSTAGKIRFGGTVYSFPTTAGSLGQVLTAASPAGTLAWQTPAGGGGGGIGGIGGVSSVGLTVPSTFAVSGSPITTSGTLGVTWTNQSANSILSGPLFGAPATPSFRSLVSVDIPALDAAKITTGTFAPFLIPSLDASKITTGVLGTARGGTGIGAYAKGDIVYSDAVNSLAGLPLGASGQFLAVSASGLPAWQTLPSSSGGGGGVTSVAATVPSFLSVSGSPITTSGTLGITLATQSANAVFTGPISGANAVPTFRALTATDIPDLDAAKTSSGIFPFARGGLGFANSSKGDIVYADAANSLGRIGIGTLGQVLTVNAGGMPAWQTPTGGGGGGIGGSGGVSSVGLTAPSTFSVSGSPVTTAGTLGIAWTNQTANSILSGPIFGAASAPAFRTLVAADIPNLDAGKITTGVFATSQIPALDAANLTVNVGTSGQFLGVNAGGTPTWQALPVSANGTVTSVGATVPSFLAVSGSPITTSGTLDITLATQSANAVFVGPVSGANAVPTFRALTATDIPDLDAAKTSSGIFDILRIPDISTAKITAGVLGTARGGTGLSSYTANSIIYAQDSATLAGIAPAPDGKILTMAGGVPSWQQPAAGLTGGGAFGQLAFWNGTSALTGDTKFIWDNTNKRLAIGTSVVPATTLVIAGDTTIGGDVVPASGSAYDLGSSTKHIRNAYIDDLYIYGGSGSDTSTISAKQTVFNGVAYNWPNGGLGDDFVLTTDINGNLNWKDPKTLVPESGWRASGGIVRLGVVTDSVGVGMTAPAEKLDVVGNIQASGFLSSVEGKIKFGGATYAFPTTLPTANQILTASSATGDLAWRGLAASDIPDLDAAKITTGIFPVARGGTGLSTAGANGTVLTVVGGVPTWAAPSGGGGSSQWITSGANIYYNLGNVGIGTATPNNKLQVLGLINFNNTLFSTSLGYQAGNVNEGTDNTFVGYQAGLSNTTGRSNTAIGRLALSKNTIGIANTANGAYALFANTTGSNNTAYGTTALRNNTTGHSNTANGISALQNNTTGNYNTANGFSALYTNTTGHSNTANGSSALQNNTTGSDNTAIGRYALLSNTIGKNNIANGLSALSNNTTGNANTANGAYALFANTTGSNNTAYGYGAGYTAVPATTNITNSVFLGYNATANVNNLTNVIAIGSLAQATKSNQVVLGNTSITETLLRGAVTNSLQVTGGSPAVGKVLTSDAVGNATWQVAGSSDRRLKENIMELTGVLGKLDAIHSVNFTWKNDKENKKQLGVIAQDVEKVFPELVSYDDKGMRIVNYPALAAVAIQGVKELDAKLKGPLAVNGGVTVSGDILPIEDNVYDLGSPEKRFKSIYLGPGTIYMMGSNGIQASISLDTDEGATTKGKLIVKDSDGKEIILGGGSGSRGSSSCGLLCSVLTAEVKNGMARVAPSVPDVNMGSAENRFKTIFADTVNVKTLAFPMATAELATASVGKTLGIVSADGVNAMVGLVDAKNVDTDARTDGLVTDMAGVLNDIATLKTQLAALQLQMAVKKEAEVSVCASVTIAGSFKEARIVGDTEKGEWTLK